MCMDWGKEESRANGQAMNPEVVTHFPMGYRKLYGFYFLAKIGTMQSFISTMLVS